MVAFLDVPPAKEQNLSELVFFSREMAINVYQWLREVYNTNFFLIQILLGELQKVVQIDESLFCHKSKVSCQ